MDSVKGFEEVVRNSFPEANFELINADILQVDKIGAQILSCRDNESRQAPPCYKPIIMYGFMPFQDLLRKETLNPRLLVSPGVYYFQLPVQHDDLSVLQSLVPIESTAKIEEVLKDYLVTGSQLTRIESVLSHKYGNILGPEKLLYGAYLAGRITTIAFRNCYKNIQNIEDVFNKDIMHSAEYVSYTFHSKCVEYDGIELSKSMLKGSFLVIDDQAHVGWAQAISTSFGINLRQSYKTIPRSTLMENDAGNVQKSSGNSDTVLKFTFLSNGYFNDLSYEDEYILRLKQKLTADYINSFNVIITDFRLRAKKDESDDNLSGNEIIEHIRSHNIAIPIMVFTASRKFITYETTKVSGADAYVEKKPFYNEYSHKYYFLDDFEKTISNLYEKRYLAVVADIISKSTIRISDSIDNVNYFIGKVISLLRSDITDKKSIYEEVIYNLGISWEQYKKNKNYNMTFENGELLRCIRNMNAHGHYYKEVNRDSLFLDVKMAIYCFVRFFFITNNTDNERLAKYLFDGCTNIDVSTKREILKLGQLYTSLLHNGVFNYFGKSKIDPDTDIYDVNEFNIKEPRINILTNDSTFSYRDISYMKVITKFANDGWIKSRRKGDLLVMLHMYNGFNNKYIELKSSTAP